MFCVFSTEPPLFTHSYDQDRFLLRWTFHDQNDTITFHIRVQTTGWVGFGFADIAPNNMQGYDVIVGGFENGQGILNVSFINRRNEILKYGAFTKSLANKHRSTWSLLTYLVSNFILKIYQSIRQPRTFLKGLHDSLNETIGIQHKQCP